MSTRKGATNMRVQQHGNDLIQLTYYGFVNVYLVREEDGFTLVDTALESCARSMVQVAQQFGQPIRRILLTHAHADHSGGLDAVHELVPKAEFVMQARDARFLTGDMSLDADEPPDKLRGGWVIRKAPPARLLHEGDRVGSLEVIATPGHTPGHCSFLDTRDGTLIAGDAFQTLGGVAVSGTLTIFPLPALSTWHKPTCLQSARKLRALAPARLAVGHGRVLEEPLAAMDRAIAIQARELERQAKKQGIVTSA
jgi:glyoxylase-like metal-dependent hydrolase (beta-lactamase superfamily II)